MLATLLTQLLGKVAEAKLMHAKACNLPVCMCFSQFCWCMCFVIALAASLVFWFSFVMPFGEDTDTLEARWVCSYLHEQHSFMTPTPRNTTLSHTQHILLG